MAEVIAGSNDFLNMTGGNGTFFSGSDGKDTFTFDNLDFTTSYSTSKGNQKRGATLWQFRERY